MATSTRTLPITPIEFDNYMRAFAPFERTPHLAVAVSGGADSMALAVLAHGWATQFGGHASALIVDHGLRPESADEASETAERLREIGITPHTMQWAEEKPPHGIQAAARRARYGLMEDWCHRHGVLHLLIAHHADDQAETFVMRLKRGSGPDGLAAMAPLRELFGCRLLRPLLDVPKTRLIATLKSHHLDWVEDPSNDDPKYTRAQIRRALAGTDSEQMTIATGRFARARQALETQTARWLAVHAILSPAGYLTCDMAALGAVEEEIRLRALSRAAQCIGGKVYPPAIDAVERLAKKLNAGGAATLGGARFNVFGGRLAVFREARNLPETLPLQVGENLWDRRFQVSLSENMGAATAHSWSPSLARDWPKSARPSWYNAVPAAARAGIPVFSHDGRYCVPQPGGIENIGISMRFTPTMPLSGGGFTVA